jgi:hypothetical protein
VADLDAALADGSAPGRVRALLGAELRRGTVQLAARRSGHPEPVVVAVAASEGALRAVAPVSPALRADPAAVGERAWLLVAALVGALCEAGGAGEPLAGEFDGSLVIAFAGEAPDAELAVLAFEDHVAGVDRLRARALALPARSLDGAGERAPIGATHPLLVAARVAALGGRPADPASIAEHEEAVLAALELSAPAIARPHADPDPTRRIARRILQRLDGMGKWGGYHTEFAHLARGFAPSERALAAAVGESLLRAGLLSEKPSVGQRHVFLDPRSAGAIRALIDDGELPPTWSDPTRRG